ncbi:YfzA family protein [Oceanobacillus luteolus]|uniref:YfzA family protein n=1 Tax=Oceanobacillus luteolus TaxID=1274358 RepID=UPI003D81B96C
MRKWLNNLGFFIIMTVLLFIVDGTFLLNNFELGDFGERMLRTKLFTEWYNVYDNQLFNVVSFIALLQLLITGLYVFSSKLWSKK